MRGLTLIFLLSIIAASCTIQKRVHRPGWHIEWNKNYRSGDKSNESTSVKSNDLDDNQSELRQSETIVVESNSEFESIKSESQQSKTTGLETEVDQVSSETELSIEENTEFTSDSIVLDTKKDLSEDKPNNTAAHVLLVLAILCFIGVGVLIFGALSAINFTFIYYLWLAVIVALVGLLLILFSSIAFSMSKDNYQKRKEKGIQPEKELKEKNKNARRNGFIFLAVVVSLVSIFLWLKREFID